MVGQGIERVCLCVVVSHTYHYEEIGFIFEGSFIQKLWRAHSKNWMLDSRWFIIDSSFKIIDSSFKNYWWFYSKICSNLDQNVTDQHSLNYCPLTLTLHAQISSILEFLKEQNFFFVFSSLSVVLNPFDEWNSGHKYCHDITDRNTVVVTCKVDSIYNDFKRIQLSNDGYAELCSTCEWEPSVIFLTPPWVAIYSAGAVGVWVRSSLFVKARTTSAPGTVKGRSFYFPRAKIWSETQRNVKQDKVLGSFGNHQYPKVSTHWRCSTNVHNFSYPVVA